MSCVKLLVVKLVVLVSLFVCPVTGEAQGSYNKRPNLNINPNCNGLLDYLPSGYDPAGSQRYPLLIFLMGMGSTGDGSLTALDNLFSQGGGFPTDQMKDGNWVESYTVNGQNFKFIVITPQFINDYWVSPPTAQDVDAVINYAIQHYKVDTNRIYLTGNSSGGGPVWDYAGSDSTFNYGYSDRIAAIVPFCGVSWPTQAKANVYKVKNIPVWAFHNQFDPGPPASFTIDYVNMINQPVPPATPAKATIFPQGGHDCWYEAYNRLYTENGMNIYEWMLQYSRMSVILPVKFTMTNLQCADGKARITWRTMGEQHSQGYQVQRSADGQNWVPLGFVAAQGQGGEEKTYSFTDAVAGQNGFYRIVETAADGKKTYSSVLRAQCGSPAGFALFPNPVKDRAILDIRLQSAARLDLQVFDQGGAVVLRKAVSLPAGINQVPVELENLPQGAYMIRVSWGQENHAVRFIKQ